MAWLEVGEYGSIYDPSGVREVGVSTPLYDPSMHGGCRQKDADKQHSLVGKAVRGLCGEQRSLETCVFELVTVELRIEECDRLLAIFKVRFPPAGIGGRKRKGMMAQRVHARCDTGRGAVVGGKWGRSRIGEPDSRCQSERVIAEI